MTVILFLISLAALERSPGFRSILLSLALGLFSLKNLIVTYFYLIDDLPEIHPLMFADAVVTGMILLRLLISGTMGSDAVGEGPESAEGACLMKSEEPPGV